MGEMKYRYITLLISLFYFSIFFSNCKSDTLKSSEPSSTLEGRWTMDKASRDGKLTETLKDSYFIFSSPNKLVNNINRREQAYEYEQSDNQILQRGSLNIDYDILKFTSDTLILAADIRNRQFQFLLLRDTVDLDSILTDSIVF